MQEAEQLRKKAADHLTQEDVYNLLTLYSALIYLDMEFFMNEIRGGVEPGSSGGVEVLEPWKGVGYAPFLFISDLQNYRMSSTQQ